MSVYIESIHFLCYIVCLSSLMKIVELFYIYFCYSEMVYNLRSRVVYCKSRTLPDLGVRYLRLVSADEFRDSSRHIQMMFIIVLSRSFLHFHASIAGLSNFRDNFPSLGEEGILSFANSSTRTCWLGEKWTKKTKSLNMNLRIQRTVNLIV